MAMDTQTTIWIVAIVLGVITLLAFARSKEKSFGFKNANLGIFLLIAVGFLVAWNTGSLAGVGLSAPLAVGGVDSVSGDTTTTTTDAGTTTTGTGICVQTDPVTVTVSSTDLFTEAITGGTHRYKINENPAVALVNAGTFTASPGDNYEVLFFNESRTGAYYSDVVKGTIPCKATKTISDKLYQNGTLTVNVWNQNDVLIDNINANLTLTAGSTESLEATLKGQYQRGFPFGGIIVAEYNKTELDDVIINFGGSKVSVPSFYSVNATITSTTAYTVPAIISDTKLSGTVYVDSDDTVNPSPGIGIILSFYPNNNYIDDKQSGVIKMGIEDESNAQTYGHRTVYIVPII